MILRRASIAVGLVVLFTFGPGTPARAAAPPAGTPCTFEIDVVAAPGLATEPSSGSLRSNGQSGTITCTGSVNGSPASGAGRMGFSGRYGTGPGGDTCQAGGGGDGVDTITVPTAAGPRTVIAHVVYTYGAVKGGGVTTGKFTGDRFSGTFDIKPTAGDCVTRPVTGAHLSGSGTLH
jgi:hypothetical protein